MKQKRIFQILGWAVALVGVVMMLCSFAVPIHTDYASYKSAVSAAYTMYETNAEIANQMFSDAVTQYSTLRNGLFDYGAVALVFGLALCYVMRLKSFRSPDRRWKIVVLIVVACAIMPLSGLLKAERAVAQEMVPWWNDAQGGAMMSAVVIFVELIVLGLLYSLFMLSRNFHTDVEIPRIYKALRPSEQVTTAIFIVALACLTLHAIYRADASLLLGTIIYLYALMSVRAGRASAS